MFGVCVCVSVWGTKGCKTNKNLNKTSIVTDLNTVVVVCLFGRWGDGQERPSYTDPDTAREDERREKESGREEL